MINPPNANDSDRNRRAALRNTRLKTQFTTLKNMKQNSHRNYLCRLRLRWRFIPERGYASSGNHMTVSTGSG